MKSKKIGLAIVYDYPDYGSMLQALATQIMLTHSGYPSEAINTARLKSSINRRKYKFFAQNIYDLSIVKEKSKIVGKKLRKLVDGELARNCSQRVEAFEKFRKSYFIESKAFGTWEELREACNSYNAVLVGSDQLWLPSNVLADYYTLSFVPDDVKKICYATSFGIGEIPVKYEKAYKRYLNRIDFLSARESSGRGIIERMTGRDVPLVCDPALLLDKDKWDRIANPKRGVEEKYVFCYFMGDNPEQRDFARRLADKHGCKVVALLHLDQYIASDKNYVDYAPYNVSPADFITLVKHAEFVCTDSFHGTVFSIIYSKNFFTFKRFNKKASLSTNTRIVSLLNRVNLINRLFTADEDIDEDWHIHNYDEIQKEVEAFRTESMAYLMNALQK